MFGIDQTPEIEAALSRMESGATPLFITGKAGTGKSTLLRVFLEQTTQQVAVVAPTGVAALNVGGQTIHSFFKFRADISIEAVAQIKLRREQIALYKHLQTVIIDEVSMLRADLLDCIDQFLRRFGPRRGVPFGGIRMVFIGDLYQLPPVVTSRDGDRFQTEYRSPYFFDAWVMKEVVLQTLELSHIYRQSDDQFIDILNAIRNDQLSDEQLELLNARYEEANEAFSEDDVIIALTSTNDLADRVNQYQLQALSSQSRSCAGKLTGSMQERDLPTKLTLQVKVGAQVMLVNNDPNGRWVNGSLGKITDMRKQGPERIIEVELANGPFVEVTPVTWEQFSYKFDAENDEVTQEGIGAFTQFPLRLAWAITIHKAQGKTFEEVVIDLGRGTFASGQLYVALSRCRTLRGIRLRQPIEQRHVQVDTRIINFLATTAPDQSS